MLRRSFMVLFKDGTIEPVPDFQGVAKILSDLGKMGERYLQTFMMHSWKPGRWMDFPKGRIFCVDKEIR